jgi:hypothetical protein
MSFPSRSVASLPQIIQTDTYEYRMYHDSGIWKVHKRYIDMGEIATRKNPVFTQKIVDFYPKYPEAFDQFVEILAAWRDKCQTRTGKSARLI